MPLNDPTSNFFPLPALDALLDRAEQLRPSPNAEAQALKLIERDLPIAEVDFPGFIAALNEAKAGIGAFDRMFGSERMVKVLLLKSVFREKRRGKPTRFILAEDATGETVDISETVDLPEHEARELLARGIARAVAEAEIL